MASTAPLISVPKTLCFWRTHMGLCGRRMACLPMGPFVATGRLSCAKYNHFPISRMFFLPQRKMRWTGTGREVAPHGNSPVNLSAPAGLPRPSLSSLCLYPSPYASLSLSSFINVQCLSILVCLSISVFLCVFISASLFQSLLVSVTLLSLSLSLPPPFPLSPSCHSSPF